MERQGMGAAMEEIMRNLVACALVVSLLALVLSACIVDEPTPPVSPLATPGDAPGESIDLQSILNWLVANQEVIALATAFVVSLVSRGMKGLEATGSQLMLQIEKLARDQVLADGVDKMSETVAGVLDKIPPTLKPILAAYAAMKGKSLDELVRDLCQKWYDKAVRKAG